eukprot:417888_1
MLLNVIEMAQLIKLYQERTGITDDMIAGTGGGIGSGGNEGSQEAVPQKENFDLKLVSFDSKAKIKIIKEVRSITSLGLKEAKELVEGSPKVLKKEIPKKEADELAEKLKALGAEVVLE